MGNLGELAAFVERVFDRIRDDRNPHYYEQPLPNELDNQISDFVKVFIRSEAAGRELILRKSTEKNSFALIIFAERMAVLAVREQSRERLLEGLIALIIEGFKFDYRDTMMVFAPLLHSARKIGVDPVELFNEAASHAKNLVSEYLIDFLKRSPNDQSLKAMGFKEVATPEGFKYERLPWGACNSNKGLANDPD
jgi:hypothetical protein